MGSRAAGQACHEGGELTTSPGVHRMRRLFRTRKERSLLKTYGECL